MSEESRDSSPFEVVDLEINFFSPYWSRWPLGSNPSPLNENSWPDLHWQRRLLRLIKSAKPASSDPTKTPCQSSGPAKIYCQENGSKSSISNLIQDQQASKPQHQPHPQRSAPPTWDPKVKSSPFWSMFPEGQLLPLLKSGAHRSTPPPFEVCCPKVNFSLFKSGTQRSTPPHFE